MSGFLDGWIGIQNWIFEAVVSPVLFRFGLMEWFEPAFNAVEFFMLGVVQIVVIALGMRLLERRWSPERAGERGLIGVDRVYTVLNKLGVIPLVVFILAYPITTEIERQVRVLGVTPPRLEHLVPWLRDHALVTFLLYFALFDFAAYWVHRAQHRFSWWWALHSLHHSQRQVTVWTDDRNHVVDDLLVTLVLVVFSQFVGVQPDDYVLILMIGRLIESWSHANVDQNFGWLIVGPRFHRLHHALASDEERHIQDHNFAPVFPVWDILFGTALYDRKIRPTGVAEMHIDADNGRGWIGQQVTVFWRFLGALVPRFNRA
ncbi:MAG: sterol desaturase family protein [Proteobacteria bacterium]|nr:sterol desaturase family protein [Pseudomonadota bacterium]